MQVHETMSCKVLPHNCKNEYQDAKYGPSMRVCNPTKEPKTFHCTVCGGNVNG